MKKLLLLLFAFIFLLCGCTVNREAGSTPPSSDVSSIVSESSDVANDSEVSGVVPESSDAANDEDVFLQKGFDLMDNEKIGGLYCSMPEKDVISLLGEPTTKEDRIFAEADAMYHWDVTYSKIGLKINFSSGEENGAGEIYYFSIDSAAFEGSTLRGIRIGSKKQEVLDAYQNEINFKEMEEMEELGGSDGEMIIAGSMYGGMIFTLNDSGEVESIFIGAGAE